MMVMMMLQLVMVVFAGRLRYVRKLERLQCGKRGGRQIAGAVQFADRGWWPQMASPVQNVVVRVVVMVAGVVFCKQ